jgi:starch phosphorylase
MPNIVHDIPNHFSLPRRINRLGQIAYNLWWVWNPDGQRLFMHIDKPLWERLDHNPVAFLHQVERARLNVMTNDRYYLDFYDRVMNSFDQYLRETDTWFSKTYPQLKGKQIAYLSFEFGLHESLPVYAGGLGVLSGDHLKEASDLGLPLVGVGFIYNQGYFKQKISEDGWQESRNYFMDFERAPVVPLFESTGKPVMISVSLAGRQVWARIYEIRVGRVNLYLLDSNVDENSPGDRQLTSRLYSNDPEVRISQEILLGMGGVQALRKLGYAPDIWHMNEGHSAFLTIERIREFIAQGDNFEQAAEKVRQTNVFTTHTPVPAGNDQFPVWLVDKYFGPILSELGLTRDQFINMGMHVQPWGETFSMPVLAMRLSKQCNAVSELHARVSRRMWNFLWSDLKEDEVPISYITNAVHSGTWLARRMRLLFERYLGADWLEHVDDPDLWNQIDNIPDRDLWLVRQHLKRKLVNYANDRARQQWLSGTVHPVQVIAAGVLMDPYTLTLGFARRFATYKRGNLVMRDFDRLMRILNNSQTPVQIVFAGKAHPADEPAKQLIQSVYRTVKDAKTGGRLVFLEDYDMNVARYLVQGVDVWLNTPRRPNEASGTSGMKAALNGVLNFSVLDGWWHEGYNGRNGWAIGDETDYPDPNQQDEADAESLYEVLENEIIPLYYTSRSADNMPSDWVARMKESIRTTVPQFCMRRMLKEYIQGPYLAELLPQIDPVKA